MSSLENALCFEGGMLYEAFSITNTFLIDATALSRSSQQRDDKQLLLPLRASTAASACAQSFLGTATVLNSRRGKSMPSHPPTIQISPPVEGRGGRSKFSPIFFLEHGSELCLTSLEELPGP